MIAKFSITSILLFAAALLTTLFLCYRMVKEKKHEGIVLKRILFGFSLILTILLFLFNIDEPLFIISGLLGQGLKSLPRFVVVFLLLFVSYGVIFKIVLFSRYKKQSLVFIIGFAVLFIFSLLTVNDSLFIFGSISLMIGIGIAVHGRQRKVLSLIPLFVYIGSFLVLQLLAFAFDVDVMKICVVTDDVKAYGALSPAVSVILYLGSFYYYKVKGKK